MSFIENIFKKKKVCTEIAPSPSCIKDQLETIFNKVPAMFLIIPTDKITGVNYVSKVHLGDSKVHIDFQSKLGKVGLTIIKEDERYHAMYTGIREEIFFMVYDNYLDYYKGNIEDCKLALQEIIDHINSI